MGFKGAKPFCESLSTFFSEESRGPSRPERQVKRDLRGKSQAEKGKRQKKKRAHKRMAGCLAADEPLPVDLSGETVYYVGPCFDKNGNPKGAGPTTSGRMDSYAPALYDAGVRATVGKGDRSPAVYDAIKRNGALYLCAIGGAGALYAKAMVSVHTAAYGDLGTEAIRRMEVRDFPVIVGIDQHGNSIFAK